MIRYFTPYCSGHLIIKQMTSICLVLWNWFFDLPWNQCCAINFYSWKLDQTFSSKCLKIPKIGFLGMEDRNRLVASNRVGRCGWDHKMKFERWSWTQTNSNNESGWLLCPKNSNVRESEWNGLVPLRMLVMKIPQVQDHK